MTVCPDAMLEVAKFASAHDRLFTMNLSAPFLCVDFKEQLSSLLPYVDILFGNELVSLLPAFSRTVTSYNNVFVASYNFISQLYCTQYVLRLNYKYKIRLKQGWQVFARQWKKTFFSVVKLDGKRFFLPWQKPNPGLK